MMIFLISAHIKSSYQAGNAGLFSSGRMKMYSALTKHCHYILNVNFGGKVFNYWPWLRVTARKVLFCFCWGRGGGWGAEYRVTTLIGNQIQRINYSIGPNTQGDYPFFSRLTFSMI
jgi:hypothetical protein